MKKQVYSIRLDSDLHERAKKEAAKENRPLSNWIETLIRERLEKKK